MRRAVLALTTLLVAGPAAAQTEIFVYGTNPQGSLAFTSGAAIAKLLDEKLKIQIRVQPMAGTSTFIPLLDRNEINFGGINVDEVHASYAGTSAFEGKPNRNIRIISIIFPLPLGVLVAADSPVKTIADIKGTRIPAGYPGQTAARTTQAALLANGGLTGADMKEVPAVNQLVGTEFLSQGRVDVVTVGVGVAQVQKVHAELSARGGVRFLSIDTAPAAVARMQAILRSRPILYEPAPANVGIVSPTWIMGYSFFMTTNDRTPDDLVYRITKVLHEGHADLLATAPIFARFDPRKMTEKGDVPYHPGAIKFFTEIGQWPAKD